MSDDPDAAQWAEGERLIKALEYVLEDGRPVPRPDRRAVIDLVYRRHMDVLAEETWTSIGRLLARLDTPLSFGACCRVLLLERAFDEPMTAKGGKRKRALIAGDPVLLTTLVVAFSHACLQRAGRRERRELLCAIAAAADAERNGA